MSEKGTVVPELYAHETPIKFLIVVGSIRSNIVGTFNKFLCLCDYAIPAKMLSFTANPYSFIIILIKLEMQGSWEI